MKKQLLCLMLLAGSMLTFLGCRKDDDDKVSIQGKWKANKHIEYTIVNGIKGTETIKDITGKNVDYIIFSGNKVVFADSEGESEAEGIYTYSNGKLVFKGKEGGGGSEFEARLSENSLVIVDKYEFTNDGKKVVEVDESHYIRQ